MGDKNSNSNSNSNGEEKLIAVARHIAKTLGHSDTMTDDILDIFSTFDRRISREKLTVVETMPGPTSRPTTIDDVVSTLEEQITHSLSSDQPLWLDPTATSNFLETIDDLIATIHDLSHHHPSSTSALHRADEILQQSLFRLEDEFRSLASSNLSPDTSSDSDESTELTHSESTRSESTQSLPIAHPITDYNVIIDAIPSSTLTDLHEMAKRMIAADYAKECSHVYSACRRDFLEESLSRLGLQKLSAEEVQKLPWQELEDEIEKWCKAAVFSLRILFPSERRLCDRVFFNFSSTSDFSFMEVCRGTAIQLLNFADAVAISSRSPERLFKILDVYETLRDLMPEFEGLFGGDQYCVFIKNEAYVIWKRVGEAIRGIFMELENLIRRDPAKSAVPGGGLHPITRYVMNYLRAACKAQQSLESVFQEEEERGMGMGMMSSLSVQMAWVMELLESNLEAKGKVYRDMALSSVFMMNNGRYIVEKVRDCELGGLLGDDWIRKHNAKVRQFHVNYQRSSWNKVLSVLKMESGNMNMNVNVNVNVKPLKERLKVFNSLFEEMVKAQSTWVVFDEQLREELKISVLGNLLPAYRNFIARFQSSPEAGRNPEKYIKYSVEDVEARINCELFQGNGRR